MQTHYKQLTDSQWQIMKTSLPIQRKRKHDLSHRDSPKESLGPLGVVYYYYRKWQRNGVLRNLTWKLNTLFRRQKLKEPTPSILSIDSQSVKKSPFVHEQTGIDGNKKVNGRKRHILMPIRKDSPKESFRIGQRRLGKDHEKTTNSAEAWVYRANCQRVLVMVDGLIAPLSSLPPDLQEMVRAARANGEDIMFQTKQD